jgi:hypothetical protein
MQLFLQAITTCRRATLATILVGLLGQSKITMTRPRVSTSLKWGRSRFGRIWESFSTCMQPHGLVGAVGINLRNHHFIGSAVTPESMPKDESRKISFRTERRLWHTYGPRAPFWLACRHATMQSNLEWGMGKCVGGVEVMIDRWKTGKGADES